MPLKLCECHGEAMMWSSDRNDRAGGTWRCTVKRRASWLAYYDRRAAVRNQEWMVSVLMRNPWMVEHNWPKECKVARMAVGGGTAHERSTALALLERNLERREKRWLIPPLMNYATRKVSRPQRQHLLSLEFSWLKAR
jgi:hypothetical protein